MDLSFDELQRHLAATARRVLAERADSARLRQTLEPVAGHDPALWRELSEQLGWTGILVPEQHGGLGLGAVELAAVMEEMGRALLCAPFFSSVCLAEQVVLAVDDVAQHARHLPSWARGETRGTLAFAEAGGAVQWQDMQAGARREQSGFVLNADKSYVLDGHTAEKLIVALRLEGQPALFVVPATASGIERSALGTLDPTRAQARVLLRDVRVGGDALLASGPPAQRALAHALDRAAIALAAEQIGGAQRCLEMALEHARTRQQFGRPIGSFQAIKHLCADMFMQLETARSACYYATAVAAGGERELGELAALASVSCSEAYFFCAAECIQIHGGIGFTWEHDAQLHFKRARSSMTLLAEPAAHREQIATRLLGGPS